MDNGFNNQNPQPNGAAPQGFSNVNDFNTFYGAPQPLTSVPPVTPQMNPAMPANPVMPAAPAVPKNNSKKLIFILSGAGLAIILIIVVTVLLLSSSPKDYVGSWACKRFNSYTDYSEIEPSVRFILNKDDSFTYGQYTDTANNHYAGTYKAKKLEKSDSKNDKAYLITFGPTKEYIEDGEKKDTSGRQMDSLEMDISVNNGSKEALVMFENLGNIYNCTLEK